MCFIYSVLHAEKRQCHFTCFFFSLSWSLGRCFQRKKYLYENKKFSIWENILTDKHAFKFINKNALRLKHCTFSYARMSSFVQLCARLLFLVDLQMARHNTLNSAFFVIPFFFQLFCSPQIHSVFHFAECTKKQAEKTEQFSKVQK